MYQTRNKVDNIHNKVVIGYTDEDGYIYCINHSNSRMSAIYSNDNESGKCEVCGKWIEGKNDSN